MARRPATHIGEQELSILAVTDFILIQGFVFGFFLALPVGPVGVLCVQRTLSQGRMHGLISGLGAAFGDALYGAVAAFGISAVEDWITGHQGALRLVGGVVLLLLALRTVAAMVRAHPVTDGSDEKIQRRIETHSLVKDFLSTFMLAITNPITFIAFAGLLATLGFTEAGRSIGNASILVAGVFAGSALWWIALSTTANLFRPIVDGSYQLWMDRIVASVLAGFGIYALVTSFFY
ncbi:MAG: LysE family transporter [Rhodospirillaceae bacterium]|jgi:threonine/homoserine/homoserine lactone efflux protein|nr:LysE family transporter [Rhodospirillaceae bacterium]MBT3810932.1 LysE family transporter [Rhodospirillaceae bacterium]MBT3932455.1 LysE family transporter [Rhodospirillaceae bacterium]MBT4772270.1 LysE family transporter [Rhodospirillaceae bacterium]MBT5359557.1 LysE family transporter [Rhodospirillaceae bacterium]